MIKNSPHDCKLDIWCLGVLMYELIHGFPPFKGKTENEKFKSILNNGNIVFDDGISPEARNLIRGILKSKPNERLSMTEILHHSWMQQYEKAYKIKIDKYVYKEDSSASVLSPVMNMMDLNEKKKNEDIQIYKNEFHANGRIKEGNFHIPEEKKIVILFSKM